MRTSRIRQKSLQHRITVVVNPNKCHCEYVALLLLIGQSCLAIMLAWYHAPLPDEAAHWTAGIYALRTGRFDFYRVNPPLIRILASLPTTSLGLITDFTDHQTRTEHPEERYEWSDSIRFMRENADQARLAFFLGRLTVLPWLFMGGVLVWKWSEELYGKHAALFSVGLWSASPTVLTWGATLLPDLPATVAGFAAMYAFRHWVKHPGWDAVVIAGTVLGISQLTKMTLVVLFAVWPLLWITMLFSTRGNRHHAKEAIQLCLAFVIAIVIINMGYCYSGTGTPFGSITFVSHLFSGDESVLKGGDGGNRLASGIIGNLPMFLPTDYALGIDLQKLDFERGLPSYLCGEWSTTGWWYYYLVCCVVKVPLGTWIAFLMSCGSSAVNAVVRGRCSGSGKLVFDELLLAVPALMIVVLVSSQSGVNRHFRYVLPAFPFIGVLVSRCVLVTGKQWRLFIVGAILWNIGELCVVFPHTMSYFNELAGGPSNGRYFLLDSNLDRGQDLWGLAEWCERHPEASPLHVALQGSYGEDLLISHLFHAGHRVVAFRIIDMDKEKQFSKQSSAISSGWYAISVHRMHEMHSPFAKFRDMRRVASVGYSFDIFNIPD